MYKRLRLARNNLPERETNLKFCPDVASFDLGCSAGWTALAFVEKGIGAAHSEILMACYGFTSAHRGVKVMIVTDWKALHDRFSQIGILQSAGIPVRLDQHYAIHHNRFMVSDETSLETGSFNYTTAAVKHNAENALVLWNVPQIAQVLCQGMGTALGGVPVVLAFPLASGVDGKVGLDV